MTQTQTQQSRAEWLAERQTYLGGTDVAAILGENQFKSPRMVWLEKKGLVDDIDNPRMRFGREREPFVLERYAEMTGFAIEQSPGTFRLDGFPHFAANPDALLVDHPGVVEAKTGVNSHRGSYSWGEPGTDQVPRIYLIQGVWYCGVTNRDFVDFAFEDRETCETHLYRVFRDMEYEGLLFDMAHAWWQKHVAGDIEPEACERDLERIAEELPTDNGLVIAADEQLEADVYRMLRAKAEANKLYSEAKDIEAKVKLAMGDCAALTGTFGRVTWKNNADVRSTDWEAVARALTFQIDPKLIAAHTTSKPGPRVFRTPKLEGM